MGIIDILKKLKSNEELSSEDLTLLVNAFEDKKVSEEDIKELVILWRKKGETPYEIAELAKIINKKQNQSLSFVDSVDVCGTGGDMQNTFNISTLSAIVASSCGAKIIKHSGRSTTSILGSVDILSEVGLDINGEKSIREKCFEKTGLMFTSSFLLRNLFSEVKKICKQISTPGFVNLIGPLTNSYQTSFQILGVSKPAWGELLIEALRLLGKKKAYVVCCEIENGVFLDELSFSGRNHLWKLSDFTKVEKSVFIEKDYKEEFIPPSELMLRDKDTAIQIFEEILKGGYSNNLVVNKAKTVAINTAYILFISNKVKNLYEGYNLSMEYLYSGKAWEQFHALKNCIQKV